jgi:uncharacterized protein (DUF1697 family)
VDRLMMSTEYVALLRGINLGGKNKLPMAALKEIFEASGCRDVRTYIQSGNVLFNADRAVVAGVPALAAARIAEAYGYRVPVLLRTAGELAATVAGNPFLEAGLAEDALHVLFLADAPGPDRIARLSPDRSPPDAFAVRGRDVYLHCPGGLARTRLTNAYFDTRLATTSTGRNWRTVTTLLALLREVPGSES